MPRQARHDGPSTSTSKRQRRAGRERKSSSASSSPSPAPSTSTPPAPVHESTSHGPRTKTKRTRLRATRVCGRCKRLKLRCDREKPCASCTRAGLPDGCAYSQLGGLDAAAVIAKNGLPEGLGPGPGIGMGMGMGMGLALSTPVSNPAASPVLSTTAPAPAPTPAPAPAPAVTAPARVPTTGLDLASALGALAGPRGDPKGELRALAVLLPPPDSLQALWSSFKTFDIMYCMVPAAWYGRRSDALIERLPQVERVDGPLVALMAAVSLVGALSSNNAPPPSPGAEDEAAGSHPYAAPAHLRLVTDALLRHCTAYGPYNVDYAHAHIVAEAAELPGPESSPARAWIAIGTARAALLLARVHEDREGETLWERELRRRLWYMHIRAQTFTATRLNLPLDPPLPVPRPLVVPDAVLEFATSDSDLFLLSPTTEVAEWGYADAKIGWAELAASQATLLASDAPLHERLAEAHSRIDTYWASLPEHFRQPTPGMPPWAAAQAHIMRIGMEDALVQLYRPYFVFSGPLPKTPAAAGGSRGRARAGGSVDERVSLIAAGIDPLARGLAAGHALCNAVQELSVHLLFRWLEGGDCALWAFGTRVFTAGMVMAYAELAGRGTVHEVEALDAAVGSLRLSAGKGGSSRTNARALEVLEGVRNIVREKRIDRARRIHRSNGMVREGETEEETAREWELERERERKERRQRKKKGGKGGEDGEEITDPYTGQTIALPMAEHEQEDSTAPPSPPSLDWFPASSAAEPDALAGLGIGGPLSLPLWDDWEVLFREFLQP